MKRLILLLLLACASANSFGGGGFGAALGNAGAVQRGMNDAEQDRLSIENMRLQNELLRRQLQSGSEIRVCLTVNAMVGTRITLPSGRSGVVTQLLGTAEGCPTARFPIVGIVADE